MDNLKWIQNEMPGLETASEINKYGLMEVCRSALRHFLYANI